MKTILYNMNYFLREVKTSFQLNLVPNLFSLLSIGMIFFILAMIASGWWISEHVIDVIQEEAEINAYHTEYLSETDLINLSESINSIEGVRASRVVSDVEAYGRMVDILGREANVLEVFDDNPFTSFIEINIDLEKTDFIVEELSKVEGIEYIRDNKEILEQLQSIVGILKFIGYLAIGAVSISTLIITSHIIRLGIFSRREQINTLRLLGAPESFIAFPFILEGIIFGLGGGILAIVLILSAINVLYGRISGTLPFIPLIPPHNLSVSLFVLIASLGITFGFVGSLIGLSSGRKV